MIPKTTRDRFGLEAGSPLEVDEREDGILLRPARGETPVRTKGRVLVLPGELTGATEGIGDARVRRFLPRTQR